MNSFQNAPNNELREQAFQIMTDRLLENEPGVTIFYKRRGPQISLKIKNENLVFSQRLTTIYLIPV